MTAPIWMALPPEVHSSLLSSGPGPGSLLAAASAWTSLGTEYADAADELTGLLGAVQGGAWEGPSAEQYVAAHGPYLAWLLDSAAKSATAAALHQTAAAAYTTALATMPTLAELAANHTLHAVLVATNFFGINTIPIALNEADYVRMWVQAAETMTTYQVVSTSALAAVPVTAPAPPITAPGSEAQTAVTQAADTPPATSWQDQLAAWLSDFTQNVTWPLGKALFPDGWPIPAVPFANALAAQLLQIPGMTPVLATAMAWFIFHALMVVWGFAQQAVQLAVMLAPAMIVAFSATVAVGVAAAVAGAASAAAVTLPATLPTPAPAPAPTTPAPATAPTVTAGTPAHPTTATSPSAAPTPSAASAGPPAGGGPDVGFGGTTDGVGAGMADVQYAVGLAGLSSRSSASSRARSKSQEPAPDEAEEPAAAAASDRDRLRRRRRRGAEAKDHAHRYEYMDLDGDDAPLASDAGAGPVGFAGAATKSGFRPAGLVTLDDDGVSSGPNVPMLPSSWEDDPL
jgi:PPE-repeat protein